MDYKKIGETIQRIRISKNLTQEDIAEKVNTSPGYISNIENGHKKAGIKTLINIAKALNTTLDVLLASEYKNNKVSKNLIAEIEVLLKDLDEEQKHTFFILAKKLIEAIEEL